MGAVKLQERVWVELQNKIKVDNGKFRPSK